jgi:glycerate 2-kinase
VDPAELEAAWHLLLTSGLDITAMNGVRKRLTRWGGGKLALALAHTRVLQLIVSDVIGNDLPSIGSGPLVADPVDAATVTTSLRATAVWSSLPPGIRRRLEHLASGALPDTPRPGNPCFAHVETRVIVSNEAAVRAAADAGRARGWDVEVDPRPLAGESRLAGERIARWLLEPGGPRPRLRVQGGEPTVTIPPGSTGKGGRAQELALAAAAVLAAAEGPSPFLLAAGTDGRDGPTDAAGAVVDAGTWRRVAEAGVNPAEALARHDAWTALDAAGALLRTGPTGTNVMDLVLALRPAALKA